MKLCVRFRPALLLHTAVLALTAVLLAACTGNHDADVATVPTSAPTLAPATAAPGQLSVGDLTGRINNAWSGVTTLRVTSSSGPIPIETGSGTPAPPANNAIEVWTTPNNRQVIEVVDGAVTNEHVFVDGVVYMKGVFVASAVAPEVGAETWITLDRNIVPRDTPVGNRIAYLTREPACPFANMSEDLLNQPVTESGNVQVGSRSCTLYTFGDTGGQRNEIRYEIALDEHDLPCQVVQRAGGFQNSSVYEINNDDIVIIAPDSGTPVSGTPEG